jgi:predicted nucleotidyltransferase/uncharacterized protein (UPF0332 family)
MEEVQKEVPKDVEKKLKAIKEKLEKFKVNALKSVKEIIGIALLPPREDKKEDINVLVLVDDSQVKFEEKFKFREDIIKKVNEDAGKIDKRIVPDVLILEELWQNCYDGKHELLQLISVGAPVYDKGMLAAIKISEIHKSMVIKKFEKYVVSYVLVGSLVQGKSTPESDIDVFIVVDDTDVKKMTRVELREKLRAIILGMGTEAGMITGIKNKINIQVYILTDFWDGLKEANPVYFTFLRDGVPFYDRGTFMPWKLLLRMGRIKPSTESIDLHMSSGDQMLKRVHYKLNEVGMEDLFWATLNPSQAALMLYGLPPPTPKETPQLLREIFVRKEGLLEEEYVKIMEDIIKMRKELEHNPKLDITGKEVDALLSGAEKYLKRISRLFTQIQKEKEKESILHIYESVVTAIRDALNVVNIEKTGDEEIEQKFNNYLIASGKVPAKASRMLRDILKAKKDYDQGKLTKSEIDSVKNVSAQFTRLVVEFLQKARGKEIEKTKIRVKHGDKFAEITLLNDRAFIIDDIDAPQKQAFSAVINSDGSLGEIKDATIDELEKYLAEAKIPEKVFVKQAVFAKIKERYGADSEVLITF